VIIEIDLTGPTAVIALAEPEDCQRFHVAARGGDPAALEAALAVNAVGRLLPTGDALIDTAAVRRMAAGRVPAAWENDFTAMLRYAASKGWLDDSGTAIQAHIDWPA
jgi:hypothetical protein